MKYAAETPQDYLALLDRDWRHDHLIAVRDMVRELAPHWPETMGWGMLRFASSDDDRMIYLNAQKGYVSVYVGNVKALDPEGALLDGLNYGKGCLRVRKTENLARIRSIIERKVAPRAP
ncbi:MAG: DUF1801 domain-containing protein [Pseudomonadota bacterium]